MSYSLAMHFVIDRKRDLKLIVVTMYHIRKIDINNLRIFPFLCFREDILKTSKLCEFRKRV